MFIRSADVIHVEIFPTVPSVFGLEHGTLNAMFRLLNPKLDNLRISRYLVIMVTSFIIDLHNDCVLFYYKTSGSL